MQETPKSPTVFNADTEYFQQEWQDYYPTIIKLVKRGIRVLDIGCGRGGLAKHLKDNFDCDVAGLDISEEAVNICKSKGIPAIQCDIEKEEIPGTYDMIILSAVIEQLVDPSVILHKLRDNLVANGSIIVGVPNSSHIYARFSYLLGKNIKRFGDNDEDFKYGLQPPGHLQFFTKTALSALLEKNSFKPIQWSYHRHALPAFHNRRKNLFYRLSGYLGKTLYSIDHPLFSVFFAVRAQKL